MRFRDDLLAAAQGMAGREGVGDASQDALEPPRRNRQDRLIERLARLGERGGPRGREDGPQSHRSRQIWLEAPPFLLVDHGGVPLAVRHTAANVDDSRMLEVMLDAVSPIRRPHGRPGRPRKRTEKLHADKGYDFGRCREALRQRGIIPRIGRRGLDSSERLGRHRWVVERTLAWLNRYRRLKVRYEKLADGHQAFLSLGCALVCWNFLQRIC